MKLPRLNTLIRQVAKELKLDPETITVQMHIQDGRYVSVIGSEEDRKYMVAVDNELRYAVVNPVAYFKSDIAFRRLVLDPAYAARKY